MPTDDEIAPLVDELLGTGGALSWSSVEALESLTRVRHVGVIRSTLHNALAVDHALISQVDLEVADIDSPSRALFRLQERRGLDWFESWIVDSEPEVFVRVIALHDAVRFAFISGPDTPLSQEFQ